MTKIKKNITHDRLSIEAHFVSGASFKFAINRSSESLSIAFSNNPTEVQLQGKLFMKWMRPQTGETNIDRINRLEELANSCNNGKEFIDKIILNGA